MSTPLVAIHPDNVQATVAHTYARPLCRYLFFTFGTGPGARDFIGRLFPKVTSAKGWEDKQADPDATLVNVAFSFPGLEATGVLGADALARFARDFREGASPELLHDGKNASWWEGVPPAELHCLVILYAPNQPSLDGLTGDIQKAAVATGTRHRIVRANGQTIDGHVLASPRHLHFGYLDGFSGPSVAWSDPAQDPHVDFRHFLLGYSTAAIESDPRDLGGSADAEAVAFARDGSYAAFRLMYQDVAAFNRFVAANVKSIAASQKMTEPEAAIWLKEKMLGRKLDGVPLAPGAVGQPVLATDHFDYTNDKAGLHCPFSAHVRVVNPRNQVIIDPHPSPPPRVLRRGMPYGTELKDGSTQDDGGDRGLIGLFLCSSLTFQFQILMDWINSNNFSAEFGDGTKQDPLLGNREVPLASTNFVIPTPKGEVVASGLTTFVKARGTSYLLFPSMAALRQIAT
jgi:deferrochelatase/peroxidase EfeB